jgi:hypothetical protein
MTLVAASGLIPALLSGFQSFLLSFAMIWKPGLERAE